jgi:hypothetical protein
MIGCVKKYVFRYVSIDNGIREEKYWYQRDKEEYCTIITVKDREKRISVRNTLRRESLPHCTLFREDGSKQQTTEAAGAMHSNCIHGVVNLVQIQLIQEYSKKLKWLLLVVIDKSNLSKTWPVHNGPIIIYA